MDGCDLTRIDGERDMFKDERVLLANRDVVESKHRIPPFLVGLYH